MLTVVLSQKLWSRMFAMYNSSSQGRYPNLKTRHPKTYCHISQLSITTSYLTCHSSPSGRVLCEEESPFKFRDQKRRFTAYRESSSQTVRCTSNCGSIAMLTTTKADCHLYIRSYRRHVHVHSLRHTPHTDSIRFGTLALGIGYWALCQLQ